MQFSTPSRYSPCPPSPSQQGDFRDYTSLLGDSSGGFQTAKGKYFPATVCLQYIYIYYIHILFWKIKQKQWSRQDNRKPQYSWLWFKSCPQPSLRCSRLPSDGHALFQQSLLDEHIVKTAGFHCSHKSIMATCVSICYHNYSCLKVKETGWEMLSNLTMLHSASWNWDSMGFQIRVLVVTLDSVHICEVNSETTERISRQVHCCQHIRNILHLPSISIIFRNHKNHLLPEPLKVWLIINHCSS